MPKIDSTPILFNYGSINRALAFIHPYRFCVLIIIIGKWWLTVRPHAFLGSCFFPLLHSVLNRFILDSGEDRHKIKRYIVIVHFQIVYLAWCNDHCLRVHTICLRHAEVTSAFPSGPRSFPLKPPLHIAYRGIKRIP